MFADDTCTTASVHGKDVKAICGKLQQEAENINTWCGENKMIINVGKTKCMLIASQQKLQHTSNQHLKVLIQGQQITNVTDEKLLGVQVDNNLSSNQQIKKVKQTVCYKLSIVRHIRKYIPPETRNLFYNLFIKPHLEYCCSVWGQCCQRDQNTLIKLQKQATHLILNVPLMTPSRDMFSQLHLVRFDQLVQQKQAILVYKSLHNQAPSYMKELFISAKRSGLHSRSTDKLFVPRAHQNSLQHIGPQIWNSLHPTIHCANNFTQFKKMFKMHMINAL